MRINKRHLDQIKKQAFVVLAAHIISFLFSMPIFYLESNVSGAEIETLWDSLWFTFVSVTTIGYGDLTAHHDISKILLVVAYIITRGSFLLAIIAVSGGWLGGRVSHEMSVEDRLLVLENELKQLRGVIYNLNKLLDYERKHIKKY
ncbi:potassium channel family protein [Photobacterium galatheae]|uniref:Potassium channel domain-containing protein n=1 Tax=Photobacterium galatheae TaxID=1654360 RepID=A0A066RUE6_9GAMM|nr:potassium channel family protein [Photobacterium galatheae]KDM91013.1 hypothetical protein EA58_14780 [Photobacterium galatheae]MCM0149034.1 two pore domain potassium channel family protein [Photobacterium galatheae]